MNTMKLETFTLGGKECQTVEAPIIGYDAKFSLPILDIPMMSDERWNEYCRESTLKHYRELSGMGEAPDYETAKKWEREYFGLDNLDKIEKPDISRFIMENGVPVDIKNEKSPL